MKRLFTISLCLLLCSTLFISGCSKSQNTITVGAKDFTEQDVLGNILTLLIKENTDLTVEYKHEMSSNVIFAAIQSGAIDVYVDYTGTIYSNYLGYSERKDAEQIRQITAKELSENDQLQMLAPLGFNNTFCLAVSHDLADRYQLQTYSDLAQVADQFVFGGGFEILNRNDGIPGMRDAYQMSFKEERAVEGVLRYTAIQTGETQVTEAFSTDGMLTQYDLVVLEDDQSFFPPYHAVPLIRAETAQKYPDLIPILEQLSGLLDDDTMRELNYQVDVQKQNPQDVARSFLQTHNLIP